MRCEQCREQFSDLYDGELSPSEAELVRGHIASCPHCTAEYEQFAAAVAAMRSLDTVVPPARLLDDISTKLDATPAPISFARRVGRLGPVLAAAACFVLVFIGVLTYNNYRPGATLDLQPPSAIPGKVLRAAAPQPQAEPTASEASEEFAAVAEEAEAPARGDEVAAETARETATEPPAVSPQPVATTPAPAAPPSPSRAPRVAPAPRPAPPPSLSDAGGAGVATEHPAPVTEVAASGAAAFAGGRPETPRVAPAAPDSLDLPAERRDEGVRYLAGGAGRAAAPRRLAARAALPKTGKLFVRFIPPQLRQVGQPVTSAVVLTADKSLPEVAVRVETRRQMRLLHCEDGYIYRGPLAAGEPKQVEFKLVAQQQGTQRLRVSVETPVSGLEAQMEVILPGFETGVVQPPQDPLGEPITVIFRETPLRQALLQIARQGRVNLVLGSGVSGERVTYSCIDTPGGSVIRILADNYGYRVEFQDDTYYISGAR